MSLLWLAQNLSDCVQTTQIPCLYIDLNLKSMSIKMPDGRVNPWFIALWIVLLRTCVRDSHFSVWSGAGWEKNRIRTWLCFRTCVRECPPTGAVQTVRETVLFFVVFLGLFLAWVLERPPPNLLRSELQYGRVLHYSFAKLHSCGWGLYIEWQWGFKAGRGCSAAKCQSILRQILGLQENRSGTQDRQDSVWKGRNNPRCLV